jgi:hypothetical protein
MTDENNDGDIFAQHEKQAEQNLKAIIAFLAALFIIILYVMLKSLF